MRLTGLFEGPLALFILVPVMGLGMAGESRAMPVLQNLRSEWPMLMHDVASDTRYMAAAATGEVVNLSDNRASYPNSRVPRYKKFELTFDLSKEYHNPYYYYDPQDTPGRDPGRPTPYGVDGVTVDAHFIAPSGKELTVPAFWYQDYQRMRSGNREYLSELGEPKWKVGFAPSEIGSHRYYLTIEDKEGRTRYPSSGYLSFQSTNSDSHGFIRVSERDPRFLGYDDGTSFIPISDGLQYWSVAGGNILKSYFYDDRFDDFGAHGINLVRVWSQCDGSDPSQSGCWALCVESNDRPGTWVNQADAYRLDRIIEAAERNGIAILLSSVGPVNYAWSDASGDLDRLLAYWRRNFRYRVARWGYSTAILAWETHNEHGHIASDSLWWQFYEAYSAYQEQTDPYRHLRTTGQGSQLSDSAFWSSRFVDLVTYHDYLMPDRYPALFGDVADFIHRFSQCLRGEDTTGSMRDCGLGLTPQDAWSGGQEPWIWAEFGVGEADWSGPSPEGNLGESGLIATHNRLWAGLLSPLGGAPIEWYWYYQDDDLDFYNQKHDEALIARRYFKDVDYAGARFTFLATEDVNVPNYVGEKVSTDNPRLRVLAMRPESNQGVYVWVQHKDHTWANADWVPSPVSSRVTLPGIAAGNYRVERWDTMTGEVVSDPDLVSPDEKGDLTVSIASLSRDQAIKVLPVTEEATTGWHQEAHDAQHTGYTSQDVPMPWVFMWQWNGSCSDGSDCRPGDPELGWSFEIPAKSHIVAGAGRLYLPAGEHGVWAINESNGKTAWHNNSIESFCTAAFDPETNALFAVASDGRLYKLNSSDGVIIGTFEADSGLNLAPTLAAGRAYVVSDSGILYAVDKNTMTQVWSYSAGSPGQTPAAYSEQYDVLVFGTADLYLHAVNNSDGSLAWSVNPTPDQREPGTDMIYGGPAYYYTHGWPVVADEHGIVLIRMHMPRYIGFAPPEDRSHYPTTNDEIRAMLDRNPSRQTMFALRLSDGSPAFGSALPIGPGGIERPRPPSGAAPGWTIGPMPVVARLDGDEVVYTVWRNEDNLQMHTHFNYEGGICEMVLDNSTAPGYDAGDCRFVQFETQRRAGITVDETGNLTMGGPSVLYTHWIALIPWRITDRSDELGGTYATAIRAERQHTILNRIEGGHNCGQDVATHFCSDGLYSYCDNKAYPGGGFWVFWDCTDPPYQCAGAYSDGYKPRHAIIHSGRIYYELNGGTIVAIRSENEPQIEVDKRVQPVACSNGDAITYTLNVRGDGQPLTLTDTLPEGLSTLGAIDYTLGKTSYDPDRRLVTWNGTPEAGQSVTIRFPVTVQVDGPLALVNTAVLTDTDGNVFTDTAIAIVDPYQCYLPLVMRSY